MQELSIPLVQAFGFTFGCAIIHGLRAHAERITDVLASVMIAMSLLLLLAEAGLNAPFMPFDPETAFQLVP